MTCSGQAVYFWRLWTCSKSKNIYSYLAKSYLEWKNDLITWHANNHSKYEANKKNKTSKIFTLLCYAYSGLKGIVHPKMKILSSFTHLQVFPNLYECLCSAEHKGRFSEECGKQSSSGAPLTSIVFFPNMEVNGAPKQPGYKVSSKYLPLCSAEQRNSYRFGTTWRWVNDDIIFIFGWTIPLRCIHIYHPSANFSW